MAEHTDSLAAQKATLRATALARRDGIDAGIRAQHAEMLAQSAASLSILAGTSATFSTFRAIGSEIDPETLEGALVELGHPIALPITTKRGRPLDFRQWRQGDPLVSRQWGIREPEHSAPTAEPDVLLVPMLAFDAAGWRLGYGGGFYDRTLHRLRSHRTVIAIGLAFDEQEVDAVPHSAYDERLDSVLTPTGLRSFTTMEG